MVDDFRWRQAVSELPAWTRARCYASAGEVELEFDVEESRKESNDPADVRVQFFTTLGGQWSIVERRQRFKTVECRYRLTRS